MSSLSLRLDEMAGEGGRYYLGTTIAFLREGGLWFDFSGWRFSRLITAAQKSRIVFIVIVQIFNIYGASKFGSAVFKKKSAIYFISGFVGILMYLPFALKQDTMMKMMRQLEQSHSSMEEEWKHDIIKEEYEKSWTVAKWYRRVIITVTYMIPGIGLFVDAVYWLVGRPSPGYPISLEALEDGNKRSLYNYFIKITSTSFNIAICYQHFATSGVMFLMSAFLKAHLRILARLLELLPNDTAHWQTKQLIISHQEVIEIHHLFNEVFGFAFAVKTFSTAISTVVLIISLINLAKTAQVGIFIATLLFTVSYQLMLLRYCWEGEDLQQKNEDLRNTIYNTPWYNQDTSVKRTLLLMLRQSGIQLLLNYKGCLAVNLQSYTQAINLTYSYFNIYLNSP